MKEAYTVPVVIGSNMSCGSLPIPPKVIELPVDASNPGYDKFPEETKTSSEEVDGILNLFSFF